MSRDYRKVCWYHSGMYMENLRLQFENLTSTEEERKSFADLTLSINNKISLTSYTPEMFLEEVKLVEKKVEHAQSRLRFSQ